MKGILLVFAAAAVVSVTADHNELPDYFSEGENLNDLPDYFSEEQSSDFDDHEQPQFQYPQEPHQHQQPQQPQQPHQPHQPQPPHQPHQPHQPEQPEQPEHPQEFVNVGEVCHEEGYMRDSQDCNKFYYCQVTKHGFREFSFYCPDTLYFDTSLSICNYKDLVEC